MPALDGMRVLDMTQYEAGTSCTQWLAWLGADVVKVEPPSGDPGRGVATGRDPTQYFLNYNGNKRSIVLNLKHPRGREVLLDLVEHFDAFVENYGPGVIEAFGLGWETLHARNPRLIYGRIKGFGLSGPHAGYNSYDWVAQAAAGTFSVTGDPSGPPIHPGPTFGDSGAGMQMALGITGAYVQQLRTGEGQLIEISMQEAVTAFTRTLGLRTWGTEPAPRQGIHQGNPPTSTYPCRGGGPNDWAFIMVTTTQMWDALCGAIGRPEWTLDPRYSTAEARAEHGAELYEAVADWTRQRTKFEVMDVLGPAGVPCSAVYDTVDVFRDQHLRERGFIQTLDHPQIGEVTLFGNPLRMSGSQVPLRVAPMLGAHTAEVLREDLGMSGAAIEELRAAGAIVAPD
jgi:crotonobetainyl-CoA:carnitine CoA-transferase CaiB-like acyl-CoA transferase